MITSKKRTTRFFDSHQKSWIFEERGKKGQFYLVAAVIIAIVIFSLATVSNYAKPRERKTIVFDLGDALNFEAGKTIAYTQMEDKDTWSVIEDFVQIVMNSSDSQSIESWFIVYGDPSNITVLTFVNVDVGGVTINTGAGAVGLKVSKRVLNKISVNYNDAVNITFSNITYNFDMTRGNNFAFLIKEENYVSSSSRTTTGASKSECVSKGYVCRRACYIYEKEEKNLACDSADYLCCRERNE